ncbi:MAG: hypothetical protein GY951_17720 [Psychromonas sp.]|nr:hypothetical protein [Psychromonas sp.]
MKMTLHINGLTFTSASTDEVSVVDAKATIYENLENMNKLEMECEDGSFIVIGEKALQGAVMVFSAA